MYIKYKSLFWMRDCSTSWIMAEDAWVENKVFRTNFIHLVYTPVIRSCLAAHGFVRGFM